MTFLTVTDSATPINAVDSKYSLKIATHWNKFHPV